MNRGNRNIWDRHPDGSNYHGQWSKGKFHGKGIFIWSDQKIYGGDWKNGVQEGIGKTNHPDS